MTKWKHILSQIDVRKKTALCALCGLVHIAPRENGKWRCGKDTKERMHIRKQSLLKKKRDALGLMCEICKSKDRLVWDHDHKTDRFRGTLCRWCNLAIGLMDDDPERLVAAAEYIVTRKE